MGTYYLAVAGMMQEWFTIPELRAANVPVMDERYFKLLAEKYGNLPPRVARARRGSSNLPWDVEAEFHVSIFPKSDREYLAAPARAMHDRIVKLGIWC